MENKPLAERLRPKTLDDYIGQQHLVGDDRIRGCLFFYFVGTSGSR